MKNTILLITIILSLLIGLTVSCTTNPKSGEQNEQAMSTVETLKADVMRVHDESMAKMDRIQYLKKRVKEMVQAVSTVELVAEEAKESSIQVLKDLNDADDGMMEWMRAYKDPTEAGLSEEEAMKYLEGEKKKIDEVAALIYQSIKGGDDFLGTYGVFRP